MKGNGAFWPLAVGGIRRRPYRTIATMICYAFIAGTIVLSQILIGGAAQSLHAGVSRMGADLLVVPSQNWESAESVILTGKPSTFFFSERVLNEVTAVNGVYRATPQVFIKTLAASCCSIPVQLIGFDPSNDFTITPWLGSHLSRPLDKDEVIVGSSVQGDIGDTLVFYGHDFKIAGRLDPTGTGVDASIFIRIPDAREMARGSVTVATEPLVIPGDGVSAILVQLEDGVNPDAVASRIQASIPDATVITPGDLAKTVTDDLKNITNTLQGALIAFVVTTLPLIAVITSVIVHERRRELSILRAMGARRSFVFFLILWESLAVALVSGITGILGAVGALALFQDFITQSLEIPFLWPTVPALAAMSIGTLLLVVCIGTVASLVPAIITSRQEPYDAIREAE